MKRKSWTNLQRNMVAHRQEWRCQVCSNLLPPMFLIDHLIPLHKGGADELNNLQALCANCHHDKTTMEILSRTTADEWFIVEAILDCKQSRRGTLYAVKWHGYSDITWEPARHLETCEVFHRYLAQT
jgi:5-methylcytosine-specific restriction endonuclease McrA